MTAKKKLIEVALPLKEINKLAAREKSIRHGHPLTLCCAVAAVGLPRRAVREGTRFRAETWLLRFENLVDSDTASAIPEIANCGVSQRRVARKDDEGTWLGQVDRWP